MVCVIQCDPEVPPGLAATELDRRSVGWRLVRPDRGEPLPGADEAAAVIVLGGRLSVNDEEAFPFLREMKLRIQEMIGRGSRYLGICLGGQLLAAAFGAAVAEKRWGEHGGGDVRLTAAGREDRLFAGVGAEFPTLLWHDDSFDLPAGAILLASSADCPHQAFRIGENAWGLQFHPEATPAIVSNWASARPSASQVLAEWSRRESECRQVMRRIMENFLTG